MENATMVMTDNLLMLIALILTTGMIFGKLSNLVRLPDVVMFLIAGIIIGPSMLNLVNLEQYEIGNQMILTFGSAFILYDGGREIKLRILNDIKLSIALLSTVGVFISTGIVGVVSMMIFKIPLIYGLLLGTIIASTDPATLVPVFKGIALRDKVKQTVISESAFNDAAAAMLFFSLLTIITTGSFSIAGNIMMLLRSAGAGILVGGSTGIFLSLLIADKKLGVFHEYAPVVSIVAVILSFTFAEKIGGSGYMAAFATGLVCGNKNKMKMWLPEQDYITQTHVRETLTFLMRMAIFILLGTMVDFHVLGQYWVSAIAVVLVLMLIARPLSVLVCILPDKRANWKKNEIEFLMWVRETGAIPAALSGLIVSMKLPYSDILSSVVFMTILITLGFQASTKKYAAAKLGLLEEEPSGLHKSKHEMSLNTASAS